ncbi:MAG: cobalamin biosynthesis protein CbiA, partial [Candidatus Zixiibacteriota bacterium]
IEQFEMLMVINSRRPQTDNLQTSLNTMERIENTAGLKFTGLISNTHLIDETSPEIIIEGYRLTSEISRRTNLPIKFISAKENVLKVMDLTEIKCPILPLHRKMLKPWERQDS